MASFVALLKIQFNITLSSQVKETISDRLKKGNFEVVKPLGFEELLVLNAWLMLSDFEKGHIASNRQIANNLHMTRNQVARSRQRIHEKIDILKAGF